MYNKSAVTARGEESAVNVVSFLSSVYRWMTFALGLSALCAYLVGTSADLQKAILRNPVMMFILILLELGLVFVISGMIRKMSAAVATALFSFYAALNGITLGFIFIAYSIPAIVGAFLTTTLTFAAMAFYGTVTKRDLTNLGSILFMALIGLIIASIINIFWANSTLYWIVTYAGVLIFIGLTAYDAQKIKMMYLNGSDGTAEVNRKLAVIGALTLYLDFVNLFLYLLRLFGRRR